MNRRAFLFGGAAVVTGTAASAGIFGDIKTIVVGHTKDAISRISHEDESAAGTTILQGTFDQEATGRDSVHWADGTASIKRDGNSYTIELGTDFNSGPLPDGWVCVHKGTDLQDEEDVFTEDLTYIAPLKAGKGGQVYDLDSIKDVGSVVIVCRRFQEYIGSANMEEI